MNYFSIDQYAAAACRMQKNQLEFRLKKLLADPNTVNSNEAKGYASVLNKGTTVWTSIKSKG